MRRRRPGHRGAGRGRVPHATPPSPRRGDSVLAFIDSDCRPEPDWLERGLAALANGDIVGGQVDVDTKDPAHPTAVEAFELVYAFDVKRYVESLGFAVTANMFVPREVFERVGEFRIAVPEDIDWGWRAIEAGYQWRFAPDAVVSHPARRTWAELTQKARRLTREGLAMTLEKPHGRIKWLLRSFAVLASPFVLWIAAARSDKLDTVEQRVKAVAVLSPFGSGASSSATAFCSWIWRRLGEGPMLEARRPFAVADVAQGLRDRPLRFASSLVVHLNEHPVDRSAREPPAAGRSRNSRQKPGSPAAARSARTSSEACTGAPSVPAALDRDRQLRQVKREVGRRETTAARSGSRRRVRRGRSSCPAARARAA